MNKYLTKVAELDDDDKYSKLARQRYIREVNEYIEGKGRRGLLPASIHGEREADRLMEADFEAERRPHAGKAALLSLGAGLAGGFGGTVAGSLVGQALSRKPIVSSLGAIAGGLAGGFGSGSLAHSSYYTAARKEEDDRTIEEHKKKLEDLLNKYPLRPELVYSYK